MRIDTFEDINLEGFQYDITFLAKFASDPDREEICDSISQMVANHPELLDWLANEEYPNEDPSFQEVEARILAFFRKDQRAIDYLDSLKTHYHDDIVFKVMEPQEYKPSPRVPDSEVIAL